ncbi:hypothetical protein C8C83_5004 [Flavobacterium sp. 90]|uniref:hypothetical protein n=1 Tax=unclassified Flavobacterium TaxID=196869 RepID=UPI000EAFB896|nr:MULTISPECIES: hypothetical protein [unclassified Flavobacterium]RKR05653.1 hypothetical protein C8C82_5348 [Flavobacterium sp. 81]TCK56966.1 hypothetical protein C8C83_5004 [Flavobacterium sp. 90]
MINNVALDVFIGLTFIFLLYSLLATIVQEMIAVRFSFRAKLLEKAILRMLEDGKTKVTWSSFIDDRIYGTLHLFGLVNMLKNKKVAVWFYAHPLIKYLGEDNYYSKPAYLTAANFSKVIIDLLKGFDKPESQAIQTINQSIKEGRIYKLPISSGNAQDDKSNPAFKLLIEEKNLQQVGTITASQTVEINPNTAFFLRSLWQESGADIDLFKAMLEQWFNDTMERTTGWYRRYTRVLLFVIGFIMACTFNVDTIAIHRILSKDKVAREQLVQMAIKDQGNYAGTVDHIRKGTLPQNETDLQNTYKMVAKDAKEAESIMGLGRPWKDSCTTCEKYFKCDKDALQVKKNISVLQKKIALIESSLITLDSFNKQIKTKDSLLIIPAFKENIKKLNEDILELKKEKDTVTNKLKENHSDSLTTFKDTLNKMIVLNKRCPIIQDAKWLQYSSYQKGEWETIMGWLITALALTLGAPFWFDLLSKLISVRGAGSKASPTTDPDPTGGKPNGTGSNSNSTSPVTNNNNNSGEEAVG